MRYLVALVLLVGLVGCQEKEVKEPVQEVVAEKGPTAAERAALYLAAKAELEEINNERRQIIRFRDSITSSNVEIPPEVQKNHELRFQLFDLKEQELRRVMEENAPSNH